MPKSNTPPENHRCPKATPSYTCSIYVCIIRHNFSGLVVIAILLLPSLVDGLRMKPARSSHVGLPVSSESMQDFKELFCTPDNLDEFGYCSWSTSAGKKCKWERNETGVCRDDDRLSRVGELPLTDCRIRIDAADVRDFDEGEWTCCILSTGFPYISVNFTVHPIERATDVIIRQPNEIISGNARDPIVRGVEGSTARVRCKFRTRSPGCEVGVSVNDHLVANETVHHNVSAVIGAFNDFEQEFEIELKADFCDHSLVCEVMELDFSGERLYSSHGTRSPAGILVDVDFAPRHLKTDYVFRDTCVQVYFRANPRPGNFTLHLSGTGETFHFGEEVEDVSEDGLLRWELQARSNRVYKLNLWIWEKETEFNRTGWISVANDVDTHSIFFRFPRRPPTTLRPSTTTFVPMKNLHFFMSEEEMINLQISKDKGGASNGVTAWTISMIIISLLLVALIAVMLRRLYVYKEKKHTGRRKRDFSTCSSNHPLV